MARTRGTERKQLRTKGGTFKFEVWKQYRDARNAGDTALATKLRNQLVEENRPLAVAEAVKFRRAVARHTDLQDLIQCACIGLLRAIERFDPAAGGYDGENYDPSRGGFSSYVVRWIMSELRETSMGDFIVKKSSHDSAPKVVRDKYQELEKTLGRPPTTKELGFNTRQVARALEPRPSMWWMDSPSHRSKNAGCEETLHDTLATPAPNAEEQLLRRELEQKEIECLASLPRDMHLAVTGRFLEGRTFAEIAERMTVKVPGRRTKKFKPHDIRKLCTAGIEIMRAKMGAQ